MELIIGLIIMAVILITIFHMSSKNDNKTYEQIQREAAGIVPEQIDWTAQVERVALRVETMIQAEMVGDEATHQAVINETYQGPWPEKRSGGGYLSLYDNLRILKIAGINHCRNIKGYTGRIESALVPEPTNEYDPNAIKVVAEDGHHLGYIQMNQTDIVRSWTRELFPYYCRSFITEHTDDIDGHIFFTGFVYIKKRDTAQ